LPCSLANALERRTPRPEQLPSVWRGEAADWGASGPRRPGLGRPDGSGEDAGTPRAGRTAAAAAAAVPSPQLAGSL
jgi:hypothetical protein